MSPPSVAVKHCEDRNTQGAQNRGHVLIPLS